jgi:hypothetical protein
MNYDILFNIYKFILNLFLIHFILLTNEIKNYKIKILNIL